MQYSKIDFDHSYPVEDIGYIEETGISKQVSFSELDLSDRKFKVLDYLGEDGKTFFRNTTGEMGEHLSATEVKINEGVEKGWVTDIELEGYIKILGEVIDASDALKLRYKAEANVIHPHKKIPEKITINQSEISELRANMKTLSNIFGFQIALSGDGIYVINDDGRSIVFCYTDSGATSTYHSYEELLLLLIAADDVKLLQYFTNMFSLPQPTNYNYIEAEKYRGKINSDRDIISTLESLPQINQKRLPEEVKESDIAQVIQGNASGRYITSETHRYIGTFGMWPVCL